MDHSITAGDSVLFRPVREMTDVYGVDGRDVPNWRDYHASAAGVVCVGINAGHLCNLVTPVASVEDRNGGHPSETISQ